MTIPGAALTGRQVLLVAGFCALTGALGVVAVDLAEVLVLGKQVRVTGSMPQSQPTAEAIGCGELCQSPREGGACASCVEKDAARGCQATCTASGFAVICMNCLEADAVVSGCLKTCAPSGNQALCAGYMEAFRGQLARVDSVTQPPNRLQCAMCAAEADRATGEAESPEPAEPRQ